MWRTAKAIRNTATVRTRSKRLRLRSSLPRPTTFVSNSGLRFNSPENSGHRTTPLFAVLCRKANASACCSFSNSLYAKWARIRVIPSTLSACNRSWPNFGNVRWPLVLSSKESGLAARLPMRAFHRVFTRRCRIAALLSECSEAFEGFDSTHQVFALPFPESFLTGSQLRKRRKVRSSRRSTVSRYNNFSRARSSMVRAFGS